MSHLPGILRSRSLTASRQLPQLGRAGAFLANGDRTLERRSSGSFQHGRDRVYREPQAPAGSGQVGDPGVLDDGSVLDRSGPELLRFRESALGFRENLDPAPPVLLVYLT